MQFSRYSAYYDLFNQGKEYSEEVEFVLTLAAESNPRIHRILELGCGTGGHAFPLIELGHTVVGIDLSEAMIARAESRRQKLSAEQAAKASFLVGDVRDFRSSERFDAVVALFHVVNYQTSDDDLRRTFASARYHVGKGGLFLFDAWYGPAVIADPPTSRMRKFEHRDLRGTRTSTPNHLPEQHVVEVDFQFSVEDVAGKTLETFSERHRMRYLFHPEVESLLSCAGFKLRRACKWMSREPLDSASWYAMFVAEAI